MIVTSAVYNASDMLRDTLYMEFASTLKNICVMKLGTASCSLVMTTFMQAKSFDYKGDDLKKMLITLLSGSVMMRLVRGQML